MRKGEAYWMIHDKAIFDSIHPQNIVSGKANGLINDVLLAHESYNMLEKGLLPPGLQ